MVMKELNTDRELSKEPVRLLLNNERVPSLERCARAPGIEPVSPFESNFKIWRFVRTLRISGIVPCSKGLPSKTNLDIDVSIVSSLGRVPV